MTETPCIAIMKEFTLLLFEDSFFGKHVELFPCDKCRVPEGPWKVPEANPEGCPEAFSNDHIFSLWLPGPHVGICGDPPKNQS